VVVYSEHTQWAVGQGFFRTGRILASETKLPASRSKASANSWPNSREINYIYDCGSTSDIAALESEIRYYANYLVKHSYNYVRNVKPQIDVMYISHFHLDHINGIKRLHDVVDIKVFVIPLVDPIARLLSIAESVYHGSGGGLEPSGIVSQVEALRESSDNGLDGIENDDDLDEFPPDISEWEATFISSPAEALQELGSPEIIQVPPAESTPIDQEYPEESLYEIELESVLATDRETEWEWEIDHSGNAKLLVGLDSGAAIPVWIWQTYQLQGAKPYIPKFRAELAKARNLTVIELEKKLTDKNFIYDLVRNHFTELVKAYADALPKGNRYNISSLCLYSGPASIVGIHPRMQSWRCRPAEFARSEIGAWDVRPGWLGTGDAPTKPQKTKSATKTVDELQAIKDWLGKHARNVGSLALPHHGAKGDLDLGLLSENLWEGQPVCFISARTQINGISKFRHPNPETVSAVADHGLHLVCVSENPNSRWTLAARSRL